MRMLIIVFVSSAFAACSSPGDKHRYDYLLMHYEADPDNEEDPEHVLKAFDRCVEATPVAEEWQAEKTKERPEASAATTAGVGTEKQSDKIAAAAMQPGSNLQALVDQCMAAKGYRTVR